MNLIERYNKELFGLHFRLENDVEYVYRFGDCKNNKVKITWTEIDNNKSYSPYHILEVFECVEEKIWIIDEKDLRKRKIKHLIDESDRKI